VDRLVTRDQMAEALGICDPEQKNLSKILVSLGYTTEEKLLKALSLRLNIPYFTSFEGMLDPSAAALIPETVARRRMALPVLRTRTP